jgi:hypothetical protein
MNDHTIIGFFDELEKMGGVFSKLKSLIDKKPKKVWAGGGQNPHGRVDTRKIMMTRSNKRALRDVEKYR